eukprot:GHVT01007174.1.p1 GENE.GHVT01007174.1~~GHVT01007174.1.p1  ORF type:complete len:564 (+),score=151.64 GHVT01007174.1:248-1939(+)
MEQCLSSFRVSSSRVFDRVRQELCQEYERILEAERASLSAESSASAREASEARGALAAAAARVDQLGGSVMDLSAALWRQAGRRQAERAAAVAWGRWRRTYEGRLMQRRLAAVSWRYATYRRSSRIFTSWRRQARTAAVMQQANAVHTAAHTHVMQQALAADHQAKHAAKLLQEQTDRADREETARIKLQKNLKTIFVRGVCALNFETMNILSKPDGAAFIDPPINHQYPHDLQPAQNQHTEQTPEANLENIFSLADDQMHNQSNYEPNIQQQQHGLQQHQRHQNADEQQEQEEEENEKYQRQQQWGKYQAQRQQEFHKQQHPLHHQEHGQFDSDPRPFDSSGLACVSDFAPPVDSGPVSDDEEKKSPSACQPAEAVGRVAAQAPSGAPAAGLPETSDPTHGINSDEMISARYDRCAATAEPAEGGRGPRRADALLCCSERGRQKETGKAQDARPEIKRNSSHPTLQWQHGHAQQPTPNLQPRQTHLQKQPPPHQPQQKQQQQQQQQLKQQAQQQQLYHEEAPQDQLQEETDDMVIDSAVRRAAYVFDRGGVGGNAEGTQEQI